jgi:DNA transposition AAA+ family ATPase
MRTKLVLTSNIRALAQASEVMMSRAPGQSRIGLIHGVAGSGKSTAIISLANSLDSAVVECKPTWSPRWMLSDIARELGGSGEGNCQSLYEWICQRQREEPRVLFLDEADRLVKDVLIETLRSIHDATRSSVWLIGMDRFRRRATARPQLARRIAVAVEFQRASVEDTLLIARECSEIEIESKRFARSIGELMGIWHCFVMS